MLFSTTWNSFVNRKLIFGLIWTVSLLLAKPAAALSIPLEAWLSAHLTQLYCLFNKDSRGGRDLSS